MQVNMRFIHNLLYKLKRQYGATVVLYKTVGATIDPRAGTRTTDRVKVAVNRAIVLPDSLANKFVYAHSYLVANRKFTYGAQWDQSQRLVVIDGADLPKDFTIEIETSLVFNNERFVVRKAERFDVGYGYLLTVTRVNDNEPLQIFDLNVNHALGLGQSASKV